MKELQELRNHILELKNIGVIKKTTEITLLHKLNAIEKKFAISGVVERSEQLVCDVCEEPVKVNKTGNWIICSECGYQKEAN